MAVDLMGYGKVDEIVSIQEAATAGLRSMEYLILQLSSNRDYHQEKQKQKQEKEQQLDCREITDFTVSKFKKVISILDRTGHARFRRGPTSSSPSIPTSTHRGILPPNASSPLKPPPPPEPTPAERDLTLYFTKHSVPETSNGVNTFGLSQPLSSANSSFLSHPTGDPSVSNGKLGTSLFLTPANNTSVPEVSAGKPPISSSFKKRCNGHSHSVAGSDGRCHCSKRRKSKVKKTIRVPAISSKTADIPPDEYSWRKYGQKPIKGSPFPRGYYKCSSLRGCPARKHVERAPDDPSMLIVTYEGEHRHAVSVPVTGNVFESS